MIIQSQPNRNIPIPEGATHWNFGYAYPFEKFEATTQYVYFNNSWKLLTLPRHGATRIEEYAIPENAAVVSTKFGTGRLIAKVDGRCPQMIVELDDNPFYYRPACFFPHQVDFLEGNVRQQ